MKSPRSALSLKILLVAFLNIVLLAIVAVVFARTQFQLDLGSFFLSPARDRMLSVSRLIALQLISTPEGSWTRVLDEYAQEYPSHFYLFTESGEQVAGRPIKVPDKLLASFRDESHRIRRAFGAQGRNLPPQPGADAAGMGPRGMNPPDGNGPGMGPSGMSAPGMSAPGIDFSGAARPDTQRPGPRSPGVLAPGTRLARELNLIKTSNPSEYWAGVHIPWFLPQRQWRPGTPPTHLIVLWRFSGFWTQPFFFNLKAWLGVVAATILVSVACWLPLVRGLTRALTQLTAATGRIAEGHFEIEVAAKRKDELGRLSDSINRMAHRLSGLVHGQRRFLSDIAHELSSPIARAQLALAILEQRADAHQAEYVLDVREEVEHMSGLVSELLAFSKSQSIDAAVELKHVNVADTVRRVLQRESTDDVQIETSIDDKAEVMAQPDYLFRSLANLVRNAIRYASHAGPIMVSAVERADEVTITVADSGPGLPANELENVFRPFYRPEFARQRETGGSGLGLAIVRSCIEACGGAVSCRNRTPKGLEVAIRLARVPARNAT